MDDPVTEGVEGGAQPEGSQPQIDAEAIEMEVTEEGGEPAEQQEPAERQPSRVQERIGELTRRAKTAEESAETLKARAEAAELTAMQGAGLHPAYLKPEEAKLLAQADELDGQERAMNKLLLSNREEYQLDGKTVTRDELIERYAAVRQRRDAVSPRAQALYEDRMKMQVADILEGKRLREEREALTRRGAPGGAARKVMGAPGGGPARPAAATGASVREAGPKRGMSEDRFEKAGRTRAALDAELANLAPADM